MKRKSFWLLDAICYTLAAIFALLNAIITKAATWYKITEFILAGLFILLGIFYWIRLENSNFRKDDNTVEIDDEEDVED